MILRKRTTQWLLITLLIALNPTWHAAAQGKFSFTALVGYVTTVNEKGKTDAYALNSPWPTSSPSAGSNSNSLVIYDKGTGISKYISLSYDATRHLTLSFFYRSIAFTAPTQRSGTSNGLGINIRLNLAKNTKSVLPFFVAEYIFSNNNTLIQTKATSTVFSTQIQPAFSISQSTNLGIGLDAGLEFKLSKNIRLIAQFGYHGVQLTTDNTKVTYPVTFISPTNIDGTFFFMGSAGLRFYLNSKKRDF